MTSKSTKGGLPRWGKSAAFVTAGVLAGAVVGVGVSASASPSTSPSPTATSGSAAGDSGRANRVPEAPLTGSALEQAMTAAKAAVPGATVLRAEKDADGGVYEVHMRKADGSRVRVALDANFKVTAVEADRAGRGDRGGRGEGRGRGPMGTPLTGADLTKASAAAKVAVPGATVKVAMKVTPPANPPADAPAEFAKTAYVVRVLKSDGTRAIVLLDKDFGLVKVLTRGDGRGPEGPGGRGGRSGGQHGPEGDDNDGPMPTPSTSARSSSFVTA